METVLKLVIGIAIGLGLIVLIIYLWKKVATSPTTRPSRPPSTGGTTPSTATRTTQPSPRANNKELDRVVWMVIGVATVVVVFLMFLDRNHGTHKMSQTELDMINSKTDVVAPLTGCVNYDVPYTVKYFTAETSGKVHVWLRDDSGGLREYDNWPGNREEVTRSQRHFCFQSRETKPVKVHFDLRW